MDLFIFILINKHKELQSFNKTLQNPKLLIREDVQGMLQQHNRHHQSPLNQVLIKNLWDCVGNVSIGKPQIGQQVYRSIVGNVRSNTLDVMDFMVCINHQK